MKNRRLVFIVSYNSSKKILDIYNKLLKIDYPKFDVFLSDDNSNDDTKKYIKLIKNKKFKIKLNKKNLGYGGNIKRCISFAYKNKYDYAIMIHGDDQYDVKYIKKIFEKLNDKNIAAITGSRMYKKEMALKGGMPFYKFLGNIVLTKIFNFFFRTNFTEAHTGLWGYNLKKIKNINLNKLDNNYNFDSQLRILITRKLLKISLKNQSK